MQQGFFVGDMYCQPHYFQLPLNYQQPNGSRIQVYAREVVAREKRDSDLPWLVYLQGGPGFPSPRPDAEQGWLKRALQTYRVLLLDQRGTGQSQPVHAQTLSELTAQAQAEYLSHFRADNIVRDAEAIREALGVKQWSLLGQSFGGFCTLHYLSYYPESLARAFVTGGIPPIAGHADEVYRATYRRLLDKNAAFFRRFPNAQALCNQIADHLLANDVRLPNGQRFTVEQFQLIGINLGRSGGDLALYYQLEDAFVDVKGQPELSYSFLNAMLAEQSYQTNPIYAILHESIYCQHEASRWSAQRVRDEFPQCHYQSGQDFCFTGEMVYPWMFEQLETLKPLHEAANILAEKSDWPALYDGSQLAANKVPLAAAVYVEDMYVEFDYSRQVLANIPNSRAWMTNEYEHNGLRADGERILDTLIRMTQEILDSPQR
ncbi:alpha/beta fold hydrolase [Photobacterium galatheae]|uniref:Alpha/beta hydrolase n=1 Tax=Photobacterium galatheae TaxID=1654360 RepID=A0A066RW01_9GAMM|nr:alpha/beta fold hydrolase [Photobacterium galatheae]KDM91558.1 alpha/beta hydrolase [Photobacterium galatheae]MCM0149631.1 alpha/beta fold hydrolase [Photobacterium galatheae]